MCRTPVLQWLCLNENLRFKGVKNVVKSVIKVR